jgi:hypothetical protein
MTITEAKQRLELPALLHREGLGAHAKKSARCPFHDDQHNSFSIYKNGSGDWRWKCFSQCGTGDEINFLEKLRGISSRDATKLFIEMAAGANGSTPTAKKLPAKHSKPFDWQACVDAFTDEHLERLGEWRGYSGEFCSWLKQNKLVGLYDGRIAFPVHASSGAVVGCHCRVKQTGRWKYEPEGTKVVPLIIGPVNGEVHLFESQWDALAFRAMFDKDAAPSVIATRGAGNSVPASTIPSDVAVFAWKQNDEPGAKWLTRILEAFPRARTPIVPSQHKDLNDWFKAGLQGIDLMIAIKDSERAAAEVAKGSTPELAQILDQTCKFLKDYLAFPNASTQSAAIALWIAHTWVIDAFDFTPYLYVTAPEKQCGKSRLLDCIELVSAKPWRTILPSESVLFREIQTTKPTLLLDEIDGVFTTRNGDNSKEPLRAVLNDGFYRGGTVPRCMRVGDAFVTERFSVFCAKAFAGIGGLPDTVVDRSITIRMIRRSRDEVIRKFRRRDAEQEIKTLAQGFAKWAARQGLIEKLRSARPVMPEELSDRQQDICEPILVIAAQAGDDWIERATKALIHLCRGTDDDSESNGVKLLRAIKSVFHDDAMHTTDLLRHLVDSDGDIPAWWTKEIENGHPRGPEKSLAGMLRKFGIKSTRLRIGEQNRWGYRKTDFAPVWSRYLSQNTEQTEQTEQIAHHEEETPLL